ncbi:MAG: serine/threonine protein kinase [Ruminococcus sp.]|nr:serine/threonine protein kinase [Ruminococcus sp.]
MDKKEAIKLDFFMSQIKHLKDIRETEKTKLSVVLYRTTGTTCILRICKGRNLSAVCEALLKVKNPNIALVYGYVYVEGNTYILEEMLSGKTLEEILESDGVFSEKDTARIISEVISGLSELHAMKPPVVHNDINTSNIMLCDDNRIKLFDFDISRTFKKNSSRNTELFGTEEYASPEHYGYGQSEPRTDIYCLGVTMHRMLTGKYLSQNRKCLYKGSMQRIIRKCIKTDLEKRYTSLQSLKKDLKKIIDFKKTVLKVVALLCVLAVIFTGVFFIGDKNQSKNNDTYITGENTTQTQMITTEYTETTTVRTPSSNDNTAPKKVTISDRLQGELLSMTSTGNEELVYLEKTSDGYRIKSSNGAEKILPAEFKTKNCRLIYNPLTDNLYIASTYEDEAAIYLLSDSLQIGEAPLYTAKQSYVTDIKGMFFSDGIMYCNAFDKDLIDTNVWRECGFAKCSPVAIVNNRVFDLNNNLYKFDELSINGDFLCAYEIPGKTLLTRCYFADAKNLYITVGFDNKSYVYAFDGKAFSEVVCLNDYQYYADFKWSAMVVTENNLWMYDSDINAIKHFPIK